MKNITDFFDFFYKYNDIENKTFYKKIDTTEYAWFTTDIKKAIENKLTVKVLEESALNYANHKLNEVVILDMKIDKYNIENLSLKLENIETKKIKNLNITISNFPIQFQYRSRLSSIKYYIKDTQAVKNYSFTIL